MHSMRSTSLEWLLTRHAGSGCRSGLTTSMPTCVATSKCSTAFGWFASVILRATCVARLAIVRLTWMMQYLAAHSSVPSGSWAQHISSIRFLTCSVMRRFFSA